MFAAHRTKLSILLLVSAAVIGISVFGQNDPFTAPVDTENGVILVNYEEFARIPFENGEAPRLMHMITEPGTARHVVATMVGRLYTLDYNGGSVTEYLDMAEFDVEVFSAGRERGLQSFTFHPQFASPGTAGYGRFYTYADIRPARGSADFLPSGDERSHGMVLLEWTANNAAAAAYDGGAPRELFRVTQPFGNHNGGEIAFNPLSEPGDPDFGLLYIGSADGGSGGDPLDMAQDPGSIFGKILRIDPLGRNSTNGAYGIPADNPFLTEPGALPEIYALGVRNPQRFGWDSASGRMLVADIGQNQVEEISEVTPGANLGWNRWEGSYRHNNRRISRNNPRSEAGMTWPLVEYSHGDPVLSNRAAISGIKVYRDESIPQLQDMMIFSDIPGGELFYVPADPDVGANSRIRRILLNDNGEGKTLMELIREENARQGERRAQRADLRFGYGAAGDLFLLNKADGVIRRLVP